MKRNSLIIISICLFYHSFSIDKKIITDWNNIGASANMPTNSKKISIIDFGGKPDNITDNSIALQNSIKSFNGTPGIIEIPDGNFLFKKTIAIPSNILIKGKGSDKTILNFNLAGNGDLFSVQGNVTNTSSPILSGTTKDSKVINVANATGFTINDFVLVKQTANNLLSSNWAYNYFFQVAKITKINGNQITLENPLHLDFPATNNPVVQKINPVQNTGIESLKIKRSDATSGQTSNVFYNYAVNCWVKGVEFENCNYAHITLQSSANITISGNYLHDAFDYGSGGKGYGVVFQFGATDNFIYDNIAKHLRHSFLLQATSNGNVIGYNYSYDPYWTETWLPANSAGDIVLHGNYPYANLFEGNIIQNLVIDNSHGINGPHNTFFRNRIENYGVVMNGNSGDNMYFLANEISGSGLLKGLFTLTGNQTAIANNIKGDLQNGTVTEASLINKNYTSKIGAPNTVGSWKNDAYIRNGKAVKTIVSKDKITSIKDKDTTSASVNTTPKKIKKKCVKKRKK
jgi:hypothetical protein